ncbi:MAG: L,D-transpeptidase family protein [Hyphomicrobium sp.]
MIGVSDRLRRSISAATLVVVAVMVVLLVPWAWRLAGGDDAALIDFERAQRRWRAAVGLPLPGAPAFDRFQERLSEQNLVPGAPVLIRIFKRDFELEIWMKRDGAFHRFATYPICRWSGALGPKFAEGDGQAPEGFYSVDKTALNPNSKWYRSFNLGFPNAYDQALNRTGSFIMVHGGCGSIGCFAMTDAQMDEIWHLVTAALDAGQARFQVQVFPFRMTQDNLDRAAGHAASPFWRDLKRGSDMFEASLLPPRATACDGRYRFEPAGPHPDGDAGIEARCVETPPKNS